MSRNGGRKIAYLFGIIMIAIYCSIGALFVFSNLFSHILSPTFRLVVGVLLLLYGVFRAYRIIKINKDDDYDE